MFIVGGSGEAITSALDMADELLSGNVNDKEKRKPSVIRNKALMTLDEQWYKIVEKKIYSWVMKDVVNDATKKRFGQRWERNLLRNMSAFRDYPGVSHLTNLANNNIPVFLAAAGPSLDKVKPLLREIHERCFIVAVDTSLRFFVQNGVSPDFVVVVDPQFWNNRHLDRCVTELVREQTFLVVDSAVYPPVLNLPFKNKFLCSSMFELGASIENKVDIKGKLGAGGSVATTAWDFCRVLGSKEIWITGLDLSFPGLKTHFHGARFEMLANSKSNRLNPAEKWIVRMLRDGFPFKTRSSSGGQVLTDKRLSLYASWFENQFRQYPHVRNLALFHEGMAIPGLETEKIENLLKLPKCRDEIYRRKDGILSKIEKEFNNPKEKQKRAELFEKALCYLIK